MQPIATQATKAPVRRVANMRHRPTGQPARSAPVIRKRLGILLIGIASLGGAPSWGQQFDEFVVTGSRISGDEYSRIPAVTLRRRADFLVQRVRLTNDTRAEEARRKELYQTIRDLVADASKRPGLALGYGDEFLIPVTAKDFEVPLDRGGKRPDTSSTTIYVKLALGEKDDVAKSLTVLHAFIEGAHLSGRTELEPEGEIVLSLVAPEKYRYEIIAKIAEDAKRLQAAVAGQCKVELRGLSNRVSWQRSDLSELTLYVPYQLELSSCQ